ncbi:hypothetical protein [uncultured Sphingomonas sp.]|uniref:hypothetical protein n=1 Tax=uncultured Sphingomonas sp. TaxID=158754 RepID=UPI0035CB7793
MVDIRTLDLRQAVIGRDIASAAHLLAVTRIRARAGIAPEFRLVRGQSLEARSAPIRSERASTTGRLVT